MSNNPQDKELNDALVKLVMPMYLGEQCKYCGKVYETIADLNETVWAGLHEHGRLACETCWNENNPKEYDHGKAKQRQA